MFPISSGERESIERVCLRNEKEKGAFPLYAKNWIKRSGRAETFQMIPFYLV